MQARVNEDTQSDGGTSVRYDKVMDGLNALSDAKARTCEYRDESACFGLQHETCDEDYGDKTAFGENPGVRENSVRTNGLFTAI